MEKKKKLPSLVRLAILTSVTAIAWVVFEVYRSATTKPPPSVPDEIIAPLDASLDLTTLNGLSSRVYLQDSEIPDLPIQNPLEISEVVESPEELETTNTSTESATIEEESP